MRVIQPSSERTRVRRKADRGRYDRDTIVGILDEALICHVGFAVDGRPWVVPTAFARVEEHVYLHGAVGNFALRTLAGGAEACVTFTLLDGLVLARSAFHHSMNYRSVMLFGRAVAVTDDDEKHAALLAIVEQMVKGRSGSTRLLTPQERRSTLVVRLPIERRQPRCAPVARSTSPPTTTYRTGRGWYRSPSCAANLYVTHPRDAAGEDEPLSMRQHPGQARAW